MRLSTKIFQKIDAKDLRCSAIHECGHSWVGRHYGVGGSPSVWRSHTSRPKEEKLWVGNTKYDVSRLSRNQHRCLALAGILAEWVAENGGPANCELWEFVDELEESWGDTYEEAEGWSLTDWERAQGWTTADVSDTFRILKKNWKALSAEARELIRLAKKNGEFANDPDEAHHLWDYVYPGYSDQIAQALAKLKAG